MTYVLYGIVLYRQSTDSRLSVKLVGRWSYAAICKYVYQNFDSSWQICKLVETQ